MKNIIRLIFLILLISCSKENKTSNSPKCDTVRVTVYDRNENVDWRTAKVFTKDTSQNDFIFYYADISKNKIVSNYLVKSTVGKEKLPFVEKLTIFKNHDSIDFFGQICYLRDFKSFSIGNKPYKVYRYFLNDLETIDEESEIYINDSQGIIRTYNLCWNKTVIYLKDSITLKLDNELRNDTSTFVINKANKDRYHKELTEYIKNRYKNNKR